MLLPIEVARLCPDCDVLTEAATCPQCGRARTFPLTEWVGRLDLAPAGNNQTLVPRLAESGLEWLRRRYAAAGWRTLRARVDALPPVR